MSPPDARSQEIGIASVYGYVGEVTASGELLTLDGLTAAHRTLPLGSFASITNELNGRSVVVRINDRGPFVNGRIIDVTVPVARVLGLSGLDRVTVVAVASNARSNASASRSTSAGKQDSPRHRARMVRVSDTTKSGNAKEQRRKSSDSTGSRPRPTG